MDDDVRAALLRLYSEVCEMESSSKPDQTQGQVEDLKKILHSLTSSHDHGTAS